MDALPTQRTISEIAQALSEDLNSFPSRVVPHRAFKAAKREFYRVLKCHRIFLVVGPSGVGKDALAEEIVRHLNAPILGTCDQIGAVMVTAPSAQGRAFSIRDLWKDASIKLDEPLVDRKIDLHAEQQRLRGHGRIALTPAQREKKSAHDLKDVVCRAAIDRKLRLLVINEAFAMVKTESGVTLKEQLDVLRNLSDGAPFRIALVSTGRILEKFQASGELGRRLGVVHFPRYGSPLAVDGRRVSHSDSLAERKAHLGVFANLQSELPESSRLIPSSTDLEYLYKYSLGCVGNLVDWYRRAVVHCDAAGRDKLKWLDFKKSVLRRKTFDDMRNQCEVGEAKLQELCEPPPFSDPDPSSDDDPDPPSGGAPKTPPSRRRGVPEATRYGKIREAKLEGRT